MHTIVAERHRVGKRFVGDCPHAQTSGLVVDDSIVPDAAVSPSVCP